MYLNKYPKLRIYILNNLIAWDIAINTLFGGGVRTISERIGETKYEGRLKMKRFFVEWLIDTYILEPLDPGHSLRVYLKYRE